MRWSELENGKLHAEIDPNNLDQEEWVFEDCYPRFLRYRRWLGFPDVDPQIAHRDRVEFGKMIGQARERKRWSETAKRRNIVQKLKHDQSIRDGRRGPQARIEKKRAVTDQEDIGLAHSYLKLTGDKSRWQRATWRWLEQCGREVPAGRLSIHWRARILHGLQLLSAENVSARQELTRLESKKPRWFKQPK